MGWFMPKTLTLPSKVLRLTELTRMIDLTAKENAFEDCQVALKKAFEKDQISLQDFLQVIHQTLND